MSSMNTNIETGVRFGVISMQSLDGDVQDELWYGPGAVDLSRQQADEDLRAELKQRYADAMEEAIEKAGYMCSTIEDVPAYIDDYMQRKLGTAFIDSAEDYIDWAYERECDFQTDEPIIEGTYEGVKYRISWLGGAPILFVFEGPVGFANRLCSPCVPNAADLDGGFHEDEFAQDGDGDGGYLCYVVPRDWLRSGE
jgi:hypothetical protein